MDLPGEAAGIWAALAGCALDERPGQVFADVLQHPSSAIAQRIESRPLPQPTDLSGARLRARALELLVELDATAAVDARRQDAERQADEAAEGYELINQLAAMAKADGDPRPIGQIRAKILSLLLRRPDHGLSAVTAHVTVTAALDALEGGSATPGAVDGLPITAPTSRSCCGASQPRALQHLEGAR